MAPDIVPCDCVMIRGEATNHPLVVLMSWRFNLHHCITFRDAGAKAVASEASLTGESAPQMKDALAMEELRVSDQRIIGESWEKIVQRRILRKVRVMMLKGQQKHKTARVKAFIC